MNASIWPKVIDTIGQEKATALMHKCWKVSKDSVIITKTIRSHHSICKMIGVETSLKLREAIGQATIYIPRKGSMYAVEAEKEILGEPKKYAISKASTKDGIRRSILKMIKEDRRARLLGMFELYDIFPLGEIQEIKHAFIWARNESSQVKV